MTLSQLETFFNGAWSIFDVLEMNFADYNYDLEMMLDFVVAVESEFYPDIDMLYRERITTWAATKQAELGLDQDGKLEDDAAQSTEIAKTSDFGANAAAISSVNDESTKPAKRTGLISRTVGARYSHNDSTAVSFGYSRTPDGLPLRKDE